VRLLLAVVLAAAAPADAVSLQKVGTFRQPVYVTGFNDTLLVAHGGEVYRVRRR
jgi:hypothetical protein